MACCYNPPIRLSLSRVSSRAAVKPPQSVASFPSVSRSSFPLSHNKTLSLVPSSLPTLKLHCVSDSKDSCFFYASWCGPCRMVHRVIDEISAEYAGRLKCVLLNADDDSQVAEDYEIKAVPVVLLFKNGRKCEIVAGTMPKEFYLAAIERVLNS